MAGSCKRGERGGRPESYPNRRFAEVHDPEGNPIQLWQPTIPRRGQPATIVAASAIRWSFVQGGPSVARGPCRTSSARSASMPAA